MEYDGSYSLKKLIDRADLYHQERFEIMDRTSGDCEYLYHIYANDHNQEIELTVQYGGYGEEALLEMQERTLFQKSRDPETGEYATSCDCDIAQSYRYDVCNYFLFNDILRLSRIYKADPVELKEKLESFREEFRTSQKTKEEFDLFLMRVHEEILA